MTGYIKLRRSLLDWEWYGDHNATRLLIHLLISVNYEDKKWQGIIVKKGSMVLSWATLSERSGLSLQQCRTAMGKLISSGEVTKKVTNKYQVVTLVKWDKIQLDHLNITDKSTFNQQTNNKQITTTKEREEIKNIKKESKKNFTPPSIEEIDQFFLDKELDFNNSKKEAQKFFNYYESKGWLVGKTKMKKWKSAAANWANRITEFNPSEKEKKGNVVESLKRKHGIST